MEPGGFESSRDLAARHLLEVLTFGGDRPA